jgi:uncharacterized surface protein with fasciclin (FAS1) repeats
MTTQNLLLLLSLLVYLLTKCDGTDTSVVLRGSVNELVAVTPRHEQQQSIISRLRNKHDVSRSLLPEDLMTLNLWEYMEKVDEKFDNNDEYSRFKALITAADRKDDLKELTGITLLAPNNDAISRDMKDFLLQSGNEKVLEKIVEYHMIPRIVSFLSSEFNQITNGIATITTFTVSGDNIDISVDKNGLHFNKYTDAISYALTNESILYKINRVLIPPSLNSEIPEEILMQNMKRKDENEKSDKSYEFPITVPNSFLFSGDSDSTIDSTKISDAPSMIPSDSPSISPLVFSDPPSITPSDTPSISPSDVPSMMMSDIPSNRPSMMPSTTQSDIPSLFPDAETSGIVSENTVASTSNMPSHIPSSIPSIIPSSIPSNIPSSIPSNIPSSTPSNIPSSTPSNIPSSIPSAIPSSFPSDISSSIPSMVPSNAVNVSANFAPVPSFLWEIISHHEIKKKTLP